MSLIHPDRRFTDGLILGQFCEGMTADSFTDIDTR
jgi:hypothetical protein